MAGMEIQLGFGGLTEAVNRLREMERLTGQIARNQAGGGTGGGGGSAAAGPAARLAAAQRGVGPLATPEAVFDAQVRALRAQQSFERAQRLLGGPPGAAQRLMTAVSTSRFGAGGVMPLVGRTAAILGGEAMAGPIGLAIAAVTGFAAVLHSATETAGEFRRATTVTGGTAAQTAAISAMGIAPGQQAGVAAGLRERFSTDPSATAMAHRFLGIGAQMPRGFGEVNEARLLQLFQERIRGLVDEGRAIDALRVARQFNLESLVDEAMVTRRIRDARDAESQVLGRDMERNAQGFRDFEAQTARVGIAFERLKISLAEGLLPAVSDAAEKTADAVNWFAGMQKWQRDFLKEHPALTQEGLTDWLNGGKANPAKDAQDKNTAALDNNTRVMQQGTYGGGPLTRGAVPAQFRGVGAAREMEADRMKLGIFGY